MAALATQKSDLTGKVITYAAAAALGDTFVNTGRELLRVKNDGVGAVAVTINSQQPCDQGFDHDVTVNVAPGAEKVVGPFPVVRFGSDVEVTYDEVTSVTVAVEGQ